MWNRNYILLLFLLFLIDGAALAQEDSIANKDLGDIIINTFHLDKKREKRDEKKVRFSIIPLAAGTSGGKQLAVSAVSASFYVGSATKLSNISFVPYTNFSGTGGFVVRPNIWFHENKWNLLGELRLAGNYLDTYGLGTNSPPEAKTVVKYGQGRIYIFY